MNIGSNYSSYGKSSIPWDDKVAGWKKYQDRLTDLVDTTKSLDQGDKELISRYKEKIQRGATTRKACHYIEKAGLVMAQVAGTVILPVLLIGSPPLAIAAAATLITGMVSISGSILWASRHPDNLVGGVPDAETMQALSKAIQMNTNQKIQEEESKKRIEQSVSNFKEEIEEVRNVKDYLPGIEIFEGQVLIGGLKLPRKQESD